MSASVYEQRGLLTVKEFSEIVRIAESTVYRRVKERKQDGVIRIGNSIRIDAAIALKPTTVEP